VETSITEAGMLIIDKTFDPKRVTSILEQYVDEYVSCKELRCKSKCTNFVKDDRINYLVCEACNSRFALNLKISKK
jgi:translation initiation factor 2 beta subunit (eIF-2beta)/eIF-5